MVLNVIVDDQPVPLQIPDTLPLEAEGFFAQMDRDMDGGWQMSREWVDSPDTTQRCQIVADKLLTALENENRKLAAIMGGYIVSRMPGVTSVDVDATGEIQETRFGGPGLAR